MNRLLITIALSVVGCVPPIESKLADLTYEQSACVRECYELERCAGDRPDPCADFCLDEDGPAVMTQWLVTCEGEQ